jgi:NAD+ kinase
VSAVKPKVVTVFTHGRPEHTIEAVERLIQLAGAEGVEVRVPREELEKHALEPRAHAVLGCDPDDDTDLAVVFGGDGTVFTALRAFAGRGVPVVAFNYGTIGFLATFERDSLDDGLTRALSGDFDVLSLPALSVDTGRGKRLGVNDISFHRRAESRVADLAYSVAGEELGQVRCDGLVAATPVGSTGYNLANGGPILAWGVEGFVVSFIAPHTLTARVLVVAPDDGLSVENRSGYEAVDVTTDGRPVSTLEPGDRLDVSFEHDQVLLAEVPGTSFYHRFREKFGRLAY